MEKIRHIFEAIFAYIIYGFFWLLPASIASNIGGFLGRNIGIKMGASRKAFSNIKLAFPDKTKEEIDKIIIGMWDNLGRTIAEYPHLRVIAQKAEIVNKARLKNIMDSPEPAIMLSGHFANWEIMTASAKQQIGMDIVVSYRKPNNPYVDSLLRFARKSGAVEYIHKSRKSVIEMTRLIKSGGKLGLLTDQKFNEGIAVPFFGHDAMTMPLAAQFSLKFDCPIYPIRVERLSGINFRVTIHPRFEITNTGNKKDDVQKTMQDIHKILETWITERPTQWLWLHRRWS